MKTQAQKIIVKKNILKKIKVYKIDIPLYNVSIKLIDKKQSKLLDDYWKENEDYAMKASNHLSDCGDIFIRIKTYSTDNLVHELYHCVDFIFEYIGDTDKPFEAKEARAYLMGYLFKEAIKLEKHLKK